MSLARCWICLGPEGEEPDGLCYKCRAAQGIEAQRATTVGRGPKDESPVAESDAPKG